MKIKFNTFNEKVDPLYSHNLRMKKGYRPKYKSGLIAVRFQDDELPMGKKYKEVDDETGEYRMNYQDLFSKIWFSEDPKVSKKLKEPKSDFVNYFLEKYKLELDKIKQDIIDKSTIPYIRKKIF